MEPQCIVIPAKAGIQCHASKLDSGLRRNDENSGVSPSIQKHHAICRKFQTDNSCCLLQDASAVKTRGSVHTPPPSFTIDLRRFAMHQLANRMTNRILHTIQKHEVQLVARFGRHVVEVAGIASWQHHRSDTRA